MIIFSSTFLFLSYTLYISVDSTQFYGKSKLVINWNEIAKWNLGYTTTPLATNTLVNAYGFLWWTHPGGHWWDKLRALTHQWLIRLIHNDDRPFLRRCWEHVCITSHLWVWHRPPGPHLLTPPHPEGLLHTSWCRWLRVKEHFLVIWGEIILMTVLAKMSWNFCIAWPFLNWV